MNASVDRIFPVVLTPGTGDGAAPASGEPSGTWTAEVPWIRDCAVSGTDFGSIAAELRILLAERLRISTGDAENIELQWSVDETGAGVPAPGDL